MPPCCSAGPGRGPALHRPRRHPDPVVAIPLTIERHVGVVEHAFQRCERLVEDGAALAERDAEGIELAFHVARTDAEDHPPTREMVERPERARRLERMAVRGD